MKNKNNNDNFYNSLFNRYLDSMLLDYLIDDEDEKEEILDKFEKTKMVDKLKSIGKKDNEIIYLEDLYKEIDKVQNPIIIDCDKGCFCVRVFYSKDYKIIKLSDTFLQNQTIKEILYHYKNENNLTDERNIIFNINNINDSFGKEVGFVFQEDDDKHIIKTDIYFKSFHFGDNKHVLNALLEKSESFKKKYLTQVKRLKNQYNSFLNSIKQSDENELYMELLEDEK